MPKHNYFPQSPEIFHSIKTTKFQNQVQPVFRYISIIKKQNKIDLHVFSTANALKCINN